MQLNERLAKLENQMEENNKTTWRIFEAVHGNGKPGLVSKVTELSQSINSHLESHKSSKVDWQWLITALIAALSIVTNILK